MLKNIFHRKLRKYWLTFVDLLYGGGRRSYGEAVQGKHAFGWTGRGGKSYDIIQCETCSMNLLLLNGKNTPPRAVAFLSNTLILAQVFDLT